MGLSVEEAAAGMYEVINVGMAAAVREITVKAGYDPRDFPLVTAGGAGPNHACLIALALSIPEILVPRESSIFCAAGMLRSDLKHDFVRTYPITLDKLDVSKFQGLFDEMKADGDALLAEEGIPDEPHLLPTCSSTCATSASTTRYRWSSPGTRSKPATRRSWPSASTRRTTPSTAIRWKTAAPRWSSSTCASPPSAPRRSPTCSRRATPAPIPRAPTRAAAPPTCPNEKTYAEVPVYDGFALTYGIRLAGPCIIEQVNTTTFVTPEFNVVVDKLGTYTLYLQENEEKVLARVLQDVGGAA